MIRWSVGIEAEGDRVMKLEEVVELADAVAASGGIATGIGSHRYGAQLIVHANTPEDAIAKTRDEFAAAAPGLACRSVRWCARRPSARTRTRTGLRRWVARLIRLGSLAGYSFEGPRVLGGWTPPQKPGVFAILYKPEPEKQPEKYAVIFVGPLRRPGARGVPLQASPGPLLDHSRRLQVEGAHRLPGGSGQQPRAP